MSRIQFRRLRDDELARGYALIFDRVDWLLAQGFGHWTSPLPLAVYQQRQDAGQNFGLFVDGRLAAVVSLVRGIPARWQHRLANEDAVWLSTLATALAFRGRDLGPRTVREACRYLAGRQVGEVYLDCAADPFFEDFYTTLGFECVAREFVAFPNSPVLLQVMKTSLAVGQTFTVEKTAGMGDNQAACGAGGRRSAI
jgi:hypothetical protein